jgi:hypothetical protein
MATFVSRRVAIKRGVLIGASTVLTCVGISMTAPPAKANFGRCSLCACAAFHADYRNDQICDNCGHTFDQHW